MRPHLLTLDYDPVAETVRQRLLRFTPQAQRQWGRMSPGGAVCHLAVCFEMVVADHAFAPRTGLFERTVLKFGALRVPLRWPHGVQTLPELVEGTPLIQPGVFDRDLARLVQAYGGFLSAASLAPAHSIFGPMSRWDWMRWGYLHTDHHLRQFGL